MRGIEYSFDGACSAECADVDGDGDADALGAASVADSVAWWENIGGAGATWVRHGIAGSVDGARSVHGADMDGDGDIDALAAAFEADAVSWWENVDGAGESWSPHQVASAWDSPTSATAADIDGDGDPDVLSTSSGSDMVAWWENEDGSGTAWAMHGVATAFEGASSAEAADIDGDGDIDVLAAASTIDNVTWFENGDGAGTVWIAHIVSGSFDDAGSVAAADIDGDGDLDAAGAAWAAGDVVWWENADGGGTLWIIRYCSISFDGAATVGIDDMDGDGDLDVHAAASLDDELDWWEVASFVSGGGLTGTILDAGTPADWGQLLWTGDEPSGTSMTIEVRAGTDPGLMGEWHAVQSPGDEIPVYLDNLRYFQYRVLMDTDSMDVSPSLHDISLDWVPFNGIGDPGSGGSGPLFSAWPNPSDGTVVVSFGLSGEGRVTIEVFDLAGRIVMTGGGSYPEGEHSVMLEGLLPGMHLVRLAAEDSEAVRRVVVIR
jgi:hypothetical protein